MDRVYRVIGGSTHRVKLPLRPYAGEYIIFDGVMWRIDKVGFIIVESELNYGIPTIYVSEVRG